MKNPEAMHLWREDFVCRDEKSRGDASLTRRFCLQGWKIPGRCIPDEKILSTGMKNPGAMHPWREDFARRDEKSRGDASLTRRFCPQGWKIPGRCIPDEKILSAGMSSAENNNPYVSEKQKQDEWALWKASPDTEKANWGCKLAGAIRRLSWSWKEPIIQKSIWD